MAAAKRVEVEIAGRGLSLSNLDKVLYPQAGFTKGHVIDYYSRIAHACCPTSRCVRSRQALPNGVEGAHFYEKQCPSHRPDWVPTATVYSRSNGATSLLRGRGSADARVAGEPRRPRAAHFAGAARATPLSPTILAFDLDPGPPAPP